MTGRPLTAQQVLSRVHRGSSSPVVVTTNSGIFFTKLRGAGQGVLALVAEIIVAELAQAIGLPVPERALIELPIDIESDDKNDELADLLRRSAGLNLGFRFLDNAKDATARDLLALDNDFAARVLWLDGLCMNPDRSLVNPNILLWHGGPWLIDHGAALPFHHDWGRVTEASPQEAMDYSRHIFAERLPALRHLDDALARVLTRDRIRTAIAAVPEDMLLTPSNPVSPTTIDVARIRTAYEAFLWKRLKSPRPFVPTWV
ncbi:MAG TPA: HipA family kinase [Polyangiaceae bacterium]|nr:HipA family kinase [Polyangiaceae bacterium]